MSHRPLDKEPSCINCGGAGHWAFACPEPTRQVLAGIHAKRPADERHRGGGKHGAKRHKGPIVNKYSPPAPPTLHAHHPPPPPPPYGAAPYGGYSHPGPNYPPPVHAPHGHFGGPAPPPGPPTSFSPPPHLTGGPHYGPPHHGHPYGHPEAYAGPPSRLPPPPAPPYGQSASFPGGLPHPPPPPPPQPYANQNHPPQHFRHPPPQHFHQYPQTHHPPPPAHYDYPPPQAHSFPQHPYATSPPSGSPNTGHSFHARVPHAHTPPGVPQYGNLPTPESAHHGSPTPQSAAPNGYPPSLPARLNIGGPGSLIRVLPPKPAVPSDRGHGRRKDRKSWKTKRNKGKQVTPTAKGNEESTEKNESGPTPEDTKVLEPEDCEDKGPTNAHDAEKSKDAGQVNSDKVDVDNASKIADKPEEGEIIDDDSEWAWSEKSIFQEPETVHLADAVAGPLPTEYTDHVLMPPAWNSKCITSKFVNPDNEVDFCRPVWETPLWDRYKNTVPFSSPGRSGRAPLAPAELLRLLETRRSSLDPGPRREPKPRNHKEGPLRDGERTNLPENQGRTPSGDGSASPERHSQQGDRRPVIDSYRPNYERGRATRSPRSPSRERRRRREDGSPPRGRGSPSSRASYFQLPLEERSRESSAESDLNSLENELLGLSPKSPSEDEKDKVDDRKVEENKKRQSDNMIPKSKRRRVQVDSAFSRRW